MSEGLIFPDITLYERFRSLVEQLLEDAVEMHSKEMNDYHGDDAQHRGLAPEICSYCKTFEDLANLLAIDLKDRFEAITDRN